MVVFPTTSEAQAAARCLPLSSTLPSSDPTRRTRSCRRHRGPRSTSFAARSVGAHGEHRIARVILQRYDAITGEPYETVRGLPPARASVWSVLDRDGALRVTAIWPDPRVVAESFFDGPFDVAHRLYKEFKAPTHQGSRRPIGSRRMYWASTVVLAVASLEAGLEDLFFGAHGVRLSMTGTLDQRSMRSWLVERPLQAPGPAKIEQLLLSSFGVELDLLPASARFTVRRKPVANAGTGQDQTGPMNWASLSQYFDAVVHVRHATAHGDTRRMTNLPSNGKGDVWVPLAGGGWSVQQPHAVTGLRTVVAVFNTVAEALNASVGFDPSHLQLRRPDEVLAK